MKKFLYLGIVLLCLNSLPVSAQISYQDTSAIKNVVNSWCDLHNGIDFNGFQNLYGEEVFYYGKYTDRLSCSDWKVKFLKSELTQNANYHQEIISPFTFQYYQSGVVKCSFTKKVNFSLKVREYPSYLLLKKQDGKYAITGESDLITDDNLKRKPALGEEITSNSNGFVKLSILSLCAIASTGMIFLSMKRRKKKVVNKPTLQPGPVPIIETKSPISKPQLTDEQKGYLFEQFIVAKFDKSYFHLKEWRSDKYYQGYYPESSNHPDFEIMIQTKTKRATFGVECKWREKLFNGKVEWAKDYQFKNYDDFQHAKGYPVFIVIGLGGKPDLPEQLFIIPLRNILSTTISERQLMEYLRLRDGDFFYDIDKSSLL